MKYEIPILYKYSKNLWSSFGPHPSIEKRLHGIHGQLCTACTTKDSISPTQCTNISSLDFIKVNEYKYSLLFQHTKFHPTTWTPTTMASSIRDFIISTISSDACTNHTRTNSKPKRTGLPKECVEYCKSCNEINGNRVYIKNEDNSLSMLIFSREMFLKTKKCIWQILLRGLPCVVWPPKGNAKKIKICS